MQRTSPVLLLMNARDPPGAKVIDHVTDGHPATAQDMPNSGGAVARGGCRQDLPPPKGGPPCAGEGRPAAAASRHPPGGIRSVLASW
jgi:hypothetical protein